MGGVSLRAQCMGAFAAIIFALICGSVVYSLIKNTVGLRLTEEQELRGADLSIHNINANPETDLR
jgi:Amt family ammonium transporter